MTEYRVKGPPAFTVHPGELMREILVEHLNLPIAEAARRMDISRQSLHAVLRGDRAVTADMALRFGKLVGAEPDLYLKMQVAYDLWHGRRRLESALRKIETAA